MAAVTDPNAASKRPPRLTPSVGDQLWRFLPLILILVGVVTFDRVTGWFEPLAWVAGGFAGAAVAVLLGGLRTRRRLRPPRPDPSPLDEIPEPPRRFDADGEPL